MPLCTNCGSEVTEGDTLCSVCHRPVNEVSADPFSDESTLSMPYAPSDENRNVVEPGNELAETLEVLSDTEEAVLPETLEDQHLSELAAAEAQARQGQKIITNDISPNTP